jgi:hypothetical protein
MTWQKTRCHAAPCFSAGSLLDPLLGLPLLLDGIVALVGDGDARKFVVALLARIDSEDLLLFVCWSRLRCP